MEGYQLVCKTQDIEATKKKRYNVGLDNRYVSVLKHKEKYYCIDTNCYHAGGSLALGDIEEVDGVPCVKCPIHQFRLSLEDGRQATYTYKVIDDKVGPCFLHIPDEPPRQRVHDVKVVGDEVFVRLLNDNPPKVQSDRLANKGEIVTGHGARIHAIIGEPPPSLPNPGTRPRAPTLPRDASPPNAATVAARSRAPTLPGRAAPPVEPTPLESSMDDDLLGN